MEIRYYKESDESALLKLLSKDEEWVCYSSPIYWNDYKIAINQSSVLLLFDGDEVAAFLRYKMDGSFGVYIYDLLVDKKKRGNNYGQCLIDRVGKNHPHDDIYVMSDNNGYYRKLEYKPIGTIFQIQAKIK